MTGLWTGFAVVAVAIFTGYVVGRSGILGEHARFVLGRLVFFVLSPFLLFVVLAQADVTTLFSALLPVSALAAVSMFAVYAVLARFVLRRNLAETVVGSLASGYVNANNIGIPLSLYLLGSAAYSAPVVLLQLLVFMPVSLALLDASTSGTRSARRVLRQTTRNPMLLGSALGVIVALTGIDLPPIVIEPLTLVADAAIPMLLISYGMSLHGQRVLTARGRRIDVILASTLKLVVMPVVAWAIATAFGLPPEQILIVVILAALPVAQNVFNFAQRYETGEIIARDAVFVTTVGCVPILLLAAFLLG